MTWKAFGFSVIGLKNKKLGLRCQDSHRVWVDSDMACAVVCDGAGSASYSHVGSSLVCNYALHALRNGMETELIIQNLRDRLNKKAKELNIQLSNLASTFLAVCVNKNEYRYIHIGDGLIAYMKNNGIHVLSKGFRGEYANETIFTTSSDVENYVISGSGYLDESGMTAFYIMSDGMEQAVYDKKRDLFGNFLYKLTNFMQEIDDYRKLKRVIKRKRNIFYQKTFDDFTLAVLKRG